MKWNTNIDDLVYIVIMFSVCLYCVYCFQECSLFVSVYSNVRSAPASQVFRVHHDSDRITAQAVGWMLEMSSKSFLLILVLTTPNTYVYQNYI